MIDDLTSLKARERHHGKQGTKELLLLRGSFEAYGKEALALVQDFSLEV